MGAVIAAVKQSAAGIDATGAEGDRCDAKLTSVQFIIVRSVGVMEVEP